MRNFDINADSLAELCFVVDRAASEGVAAVSVLMHSFSFVGRNRDSTRFWPAPKELHKFERFLEHVAGRADVEVVTFRELADRLRARPELLDGPDFAPTAGLVRTYCRSWERFDVGWKNKALALGLPVAALGLAALVIGILRWLL
jgi:MoaA/NifB/PqqE/SkfB family radical SAM enzyme